MLLVSLDLSAAFDVVDHAILLKRLSCSFGVTGVVHSYLHGWTVYTHWHVLVSSDFMHCRCTCKDPSLAHYSFSVYTSPLSTIAQSYQVFQQQYADDTQLYVALSSP